MNYKGKNALIIGAGVSGVAAYDLLLKAGANPILYDANEKLDIEEVKKRTCELEEAYVIVGELPEVIKCTLDLVVLSPGVPTDTGLALELKQRGIFITGEIELAYTISKGKLIAITGTNGKTTTTALTGQIVSDYLKYIASVSKLYSGSAYVVGNIGIPYTSVAMDTRERDITIAEISSFQLETIHDFHPQVSAILNITPDHLNRHHTMEEYIRVKEEIAVNQGIGDTCVLNYEDAKLREFGENLEKSSTVKVRWFSSAREVSSGCYYDDEMIYQAKNGVKSPLMNIHEMRLLGMHNVENVMAAICMCDAIGVPMENILKTIREFKAVEHRIEYVDTVRGVEYYNDSKGTNPDAAIKAVLAMNRPTVLIGGGYDKGNTFDEWVESFGTTVKALVLLGQTADKIEQCALAHGFTKIYHAEDLEETVKICADLAEEGDAVLLSPACASWGMFPNYEVRGKMFKELVGKLEK